MHERKFWHCVASSSSIQQRAGQSRQVRELSDDLAYQGPLTSSLLTSWLPQVVLMIKNLPGNAEDLGREFDLWVGKRSSSLEEGGTAHCSILAGRIS